MIEVQKLLQGDLRTLARAITLVESQKAEHRLEAAKLIDQILPHTGKSLRIGISGSPGVGKSTFIESFGCYLANLGRKIAVVAIDPSSPVSGGSILGDKTRMEQLSRRENVFIRPSPSQGHLGGVAQSTRESILLCEAAGFDTILVETVGVGQSEITVASMVDFFMVLMLPNSGDELQGIKKGIVELAQAIVINKADGASKTLAELTKGHYEQALQILPDNSKSGSKVLLASALEKTGLSEIWSAIEGYYQNAVQNNNFQAKRELQLQKWFKDHFQEGLWELIKSHEKFQKKYQSELQKVISKKSSVSSAVLALLKDFQS